MDVVTAGEMQQIDATAIQQVGIPGLLLMEQAGTLTARAMAQRFSPVAGKPVVILCGNGNNGGDGFVVARHLLGAGAQVTCLLLGSSQQVSGDAASNLTAFLGLGGTLHEGETLTADTVKKHLQAAELVVDALFGTGLNQALRSPAQDWVNALHQMAVPVVAVDIPSGVNADTGAVLGTAVRADLTVTYAAPKRGHFLAPGSELTGELLVADIGIPQSVLEAELSPVHLITPAIATNWLPKRGHAAHKGTFGHVLVVGGSPGMTGAPTLTALGAQGVGAGLVSVASPAGVADILEQKLTEAMTLAMPDGVDRTLMEDALPPLLTAANDRTVTIIGPGLSTHPDSQQLVRDFTDRYRGPLVIDADALNAWAGQMDGFPKREAATILTPHPGEMARLTGIDTAQVQHDRITVASHLARQHHVIVVLKGAHTVIAAPDGQAWLNPTGGPALAAGGSGDVLAGVIGGLLAQGRPGIEAAALGTFLHGLGADIWCRKHGDAGLKASQLADLLPDAMDALKAGRATIPVGTIGPLT